MLEKIVSNKLSEKLYFVYILNVLDWVCTVLLLKTGLFFEANPLARAFIGSLSLGFLIKCVAPFVVVFVVARFMHILSMKELKVVDMMISFALTVYLAVILDHIINFIVFLIR